MGETDFGEVQKLVRKLTSESNNMAAVACSKGDKGTIILACSESLDINCGSILKEALSSVGGSGGGKSAYAQGACPVSEMNTALSKIKALLS